MSIKHTDYQLKGTPSYRPIKFRRYFEQEVSPIGWILFSVGYGGNADGYAFLAKDWASLGYTVVVLEHSGSNLDVLRGLPQTDRKSRNKEVVKRVKDPGELSARALDIQYLYQNVRTFIGDLPLFLAGHSYGSYTVLAALGLQSQLLEEGIEPIPAKAILLISPQPPGMLFPESEYKKVECPCLLMTGTKDALLDGERDYTERVKVFSHLPAQHRYLLVAQDITHMTFAGIGLGVKQKLHNIANSTVSWWQTCNSSEISFDTWRGKLEQSVDSSFLVQVDGPS